MVAILGAYFGRQQKTSKMEKNVNGRLSIISYEFNVKVRMHFIFEQMVCSGGSWWIMWNHMCTWEKHGSP